MHNICYLGTTGAGKSTQANLMSELLEMNMIASGDIARRVMDKKTKDLFKRGELSPHEGLIRNEISRKMREAGKPVVLDGCPRTLDQYKWLLERCGEYGLIGIYLAVPWELAVKRTLERGRDEHDVDEKAAKERHKTFLAKTMPVVDAIDKCGQLIRIDYDQGEDENAVFKFTLEELRLYLRKTVLNNLMDRVSVHKAPVRVQGKSIEEMAAETEWPKG